MGTSSARAVKTNPASVPSKMQTETRTADRMPWSSRYLDGRNSGQGSSWDRPLAPRVEESQLLTWAKGLGPIQPTKTCGLGRKQSSPLPFYSLVEGSENEVESCLLLALHHHSRCRSDAAPLDGRQTGPSMEAWVPH
jgi:hypothetical protein